MTRLIASACALSVLFCAAARADPATDVAIWAAEIVEENCSQLTAADTERNADATVLVAEAWRAVSTGYEASGAEFLLYWRGVLADCLDKSEPAIADYEAFLKVYDDDATMEFLVTQARNRLRRLGAKGKLTEGISGAWVRRAPRVDVRVGWSGGVDVGILQCLDPILPGEAASTVNAPCTPTTLDSEGPGEAWLGVGGTPLHLEANVDLWLAKPVALSVGLGGSVATPHSNPSVSVPTADGLAALAIDRRAAPRIDVGIGPRFRTANLPRQGRAVAFDISPQFALSWSRLEPWAGSRYLDRHPSLDAGDVDLITLGIGVEATLQAEVAERALMDLSVHGALAIPGREAPWVTPTGTPSDALDPVANVFGGEGWTVARYDASIQLALMARPGRNSGVIGPLVGFDWRMDDVGLPNTLDDVFCVDSAGCDGEGDESRRTVYSTRRHGLTVRFGIQGRIGLGSQTPKASEEPPPEDAEPGDTP